MPRLSPSQREQAIGRLGYMLGNSKESLLTVSTVLSGQLTVCGPVSTQLTVQMTGQGVVHPRLQYHARLIEQ